MGHFNKLLNRYFYLFAGILLTPILSACGGGGGSATSGGPTNTNNDATGDTGVIAGDNNTGSDPTTDRAPSNVNIPETVADGSSVVGSVTFTDERPETVEIEVGGVDRSFFELQGQQLRLKETADVSSKDTYAITIEVTDDANQSSGVIPFEISVAAQDNAPSLRIETSEVSDGVYTVQVFVNPGDDPAGGGIESFLINVSFDPNIGEVVEGSFVASQFVSVPNTEDGNLSFAGITTDPQTNLSQQLMSFNIAVEPGQSAENLSLEFFQISIDGETFANTEIAIA